MPNPVSRKGKWKFYLPFSSAGKRRPEPSLLQEPVSSTFANFFNVVAAVAALISVWVAYEQFKLQAVQTTMQAEQAELAKEQAKIQALQTLPVLAVMRKDVNHDMGMTKLEVCGTESELRMVSGFTALWLSEFGRYPLPAIDPSKIQEIQVAMLYKNEDEELVGDGDGGVTWRTTLDPLPGHRCAVANEPNWLPIQKFVNANLDAPNGFAYWHKSEAMVVVHQRDGVGTEYLRHYIFFYESPEGAQLVSDAEAARWLSRYEAATNMKLQATITGPTTNLSYIPGFFH